MRSTSIAILVILLGVMAPSESASNLRYLRSEFRTSEQLGSRNLQPGGNPDEMATPARSKFFKNAQLGSRNLHAGRNAAQLLKESLRYKFRSKEQTGLRNLQDENNFILGVCQNTALDFEDEDYDCDCPPNFTGNPKLECLGRCEVCDTATQSICSTHAVEQTFSIEGTTMMLGLREEYQYSGFRDDIVVIQGECNVTFPDSFFNSTDFDFNSTDFGFNSTDFDFNSTDFGFNFSDFGFNSTELCFNFSDFGFNATDFAFNATDFVFNFSDFGFNATDFDLKPTGFCFNSTDFGFNSTNFGFNSTDSHFNSTDVGFNSTDFGFNSTNFGFNSTDSGFNSTDFGLNSTDFEFNFTDDGDDDDFVLTDDDDFVLTDDDDFVLTDDDDLVLCNNFTDDDDFNVDDDFFTAGDDDVSLNVSTVCGMCSVFVNGEPCKSCAPVTCIENGEGFLDLFTFDCSNFEEGAVHDPCSSNVTIPEDGLLAALFQDEEGGCGVNTDLEQENANGPCEAEQLGAVDFSILGSFANVSEDDAETCSTVPAPYGAWYEVMGNGNIFTLSTCSEETREPTTISVYSGDCGGLFCTDGQVQQDPACNDTNSSFVVTWLTNIDEVYRIWVAGWVSSGSFGLTKTESEVLSNTQCESATQADSSLLIGSTLGSSASEAGASVCGVSIDHPGLWYAVQGSGNSMEASICSEEEDLSVSLSVFGGSCGGLICLLGGSFSSTCSGSAASRTLSGNLQNETLSWLGEADETYYLLAHGEGVFTSRVGGFELRVTGGRAISNETVSNDPTSAPVDTPDITTEPTADPTPNDPTSAPVDTPDITTELTADPTPFPIGKVDDTTQPTADPTNAPSDTPSKEPTDAPIDPANAATQSPQQTPTPSPVITEAGSNEATAGQPASGGIAFAHQSHYLLLLVLGVGAWTWN
jgi:hypothetical protein